MPKVRVPVTRDDIENGMYYTADSCPIALALNRATGKKWSVGSNEFGRRDIGGSVPLPDKAADFVARFDSGKAPRPMTFTVEIPEVLLD